MSPVWEGVRRARGIGVRAYNPGDYGLDSEGAWQGMTPNGHAGNLGDHEVTEHDDGTITVSPSILVSDGTGDLWHGYLERGVWRQV